MFCNHIFMYCKLKITQISMQRHHTKTPAQYGTKYLGEREFWYGILYERK